MPSVFNGLRQLDYESEADKDRSGVERQNRLTGQRMHPCGIPVLVEEIEQWDIQHHRRRHGDKLLAGAEHQILPFTVDDAHIREFGHDRRQRCLQASVVLTRRERVAPLAEHLVLDGSAQLRDGRITLGSMCLTRMRKFRKTPCMGGLR